MTHNLWVSDVESLEPHPPKNHLQLNPRRYRPNESITRNGKRISCGWNMTTIIKDHFVRSVESRSLSYLKKTGSAWITKPFKNWKKAVDKMRAHSHIKHCESELLAARARKGVSSVIQQLQIIGEQERITNRSGKVLPLYPFSCMAAHSSLLILINWLIW